LCPISTSEVTSGAQRDTASDSAREEQLNALRCDLRIIDPQQEYYQVTLTVNADNQIVWAAYSHFVDFTDATCKFELREASIIHADRLQKLFQDMGEPCIVVKNDDALNAFFLLGGHALVEKSVAERRLPEVLRPSPVAPSGPLGFRGLEGLPRSLLQRAPTKKQRMRIFNRDGFRCRICGETPSDNVHVTLHVHHVRMWSRGGLTEDINLITLCGTCHAGLDPHNDWGLFQLVPNGSVEHHLKRGRREYSEGVRRYRSLVAEL
jgi:hypothetical protein